MEESGLLWTSHELRGCPLSFWLTEAAINLFCCTICSLNELLGCPPSFELVEAAINLFCYPIRNWNHQQSVDPSQTISVLPQTLEKIGTGGMMKSPSFTGAHFSCRPSRSHHGSIDDSSIGVEPRYHGHICYMDMATIVASQNCSKWILFSPSFEHYECLNPSFGMRSTSLQYKISGILLVILMTRFSRD